MELSTAMTWGALASVMAAFAVATATPVLTELWDSMSRRYVATIEPQMTSLSLNPALLPLYLRVWGGAMVFVAVGAFLTGLIVLAIPVIFVIFRLPLWVLDRMIARRRTLLRDQMAIASVALANAVRAGLALAQGIEEVARETLEPLKSELNRIHMDHNRGRPLSEAIDQVRHRLQLDSFTLFAHAINTCLERGGKVTEALEGISQSLADNQRIERKLEADTAAGRMTILLLSAAPLLFLGGFFVLEPSKTMLLFQTVAGQVVLAVVISIVYLSAAMCHKILAIDV